MVGNDIKSPAGQNQPAQLKGKPAQSPQNNRPQNNGGSQNQSPASGQSAGKPNNSPGQSDDRGNQNMKRSHDGNSRGGQGGRRGMFNRGGGNRGGFGGNRGRDNQRQRSNSDNKSDNKSSGDSDTHMKKEDIELKKDDKGIVRTEFKPQPKNMIQEREMASETTSSGEKKFTGRCRLFVGNLPNDTKEKDFKEMFTKFGELSEVYLNINRGFGFVRLDTRTNAEAAKNGLDGMTLKGRVLRVRFATHGAALKVKHLGPFVSNERLEEAFGTFGTIERTVVIVDDRGKPTGEGIIEFARKPGAQQALTRVNEGCFFLGTTLRPITCEPLEQKDEEDGMPEKFLAQNRDMQKEREHEPRFASRGSFEYEFGMKWKDLYRMEEEQRKNLDRQIEDQHTKLEMEMGAAQIEYQAKMLHEDYMRKQEELKRMEATHHQEMQRRMEMRQVEEEKRRHEEDRRRQEQTVRAQQEQEMQSRRQVRGGGERFGNQNDYRGGGGGPEGMNPHNQRGGDMRGPRNVEQPMAPPPAPPAGLNLDRRNMQNQGHMGDVDMRHGNNMEGGGNMAGDQNQQNRQSRFDQPPNNWGPGGNPNRGPNPNNMGGNPRGNQMGGGNPNMGGNRGNMNPQQMQEMQMREMQEREMAQRQMQQRGGGGGGGEDFDFENKRPRRF